MYSININSLKPRQSFEQSAEDNFQRILLTFLFDSYLAGANWSRWKQIIMGVLWINGEFSPRATIH